MSCNIFKIFIPYVNRILNLVSTTMIIKKSSGPQRCMLCLRDKDEAIREHIRTNKPCCPQCPLSDIINNVLNHPSGYGVSTVKKRKGTTISKDVVADIVHFFIWIIIGAFVYYMTYIVWEWEQILAIVTAVFWPISAIVALYYYLFTFIISFF